MQNGLDAQHRLCKPPRAVRQRTAIICTPGVPESHATYWFRRRGANFATFGIWDKVTVVPTILRCPDHDARIPCDLLVPERGALGAFEANTICVIYENMQNIMVRTLVGSQSLPHNVRINDKGQISVVDVIMNVCFTQNDGSLTNSARSNALTYYKRLLLEHEELNTNCVGFKFPGRGQQKTPVAGKNGVLQILQLLRGKKAAKFRQSMATLLEQYLDADMGLADDITDRALQAHMADLRAAKNANKDDTGEIPRLKSRDSTKELGSIIKQIGAPPKYFGLFHGGVNTAVTGMPTKKYREVQINLRPKEAAREAFTDSMLSMTGTINALVRDNLTEGSSADEQLEFMQDKCAQAAQLLGLHTKARQVQPREYIAGNKRVMSVDLVAQKRARLAAVAPVRLITV